MTSQADKHKQRWPLVGVWIPLPTPLFCATQIPHLPFPWWLVSPWTSEGNKMRTPHWCPWWLWLSKELLSIAASSWCCYENSQTLKPLASQAENVLNTLFRIPASQMGDPLDTFSKEVSDNNPWSARMTPNTLYVHAKRLSNAKLHLCNNKKRDSTRLISCKGGGKSEDTGRSVSKKLWPGLRGPRAETGSSGRAPT
jgi:hypothetical protein